MRRLVLLFLITAAVAAPLAGQRGRETSRRPALEAAADTNDARAYYRLGRELLTEQRFEPAAEAFAWASRLEPAWADPLYARHVALLMSQPRRLVLYQAGDPRTRTSPQVMAIDSLYFRALRIDPFVQRTLERDLVRMTLRSLFTEYERAGRRRAAADAEYLLRDMPPLLRGRVLGGEGRLAQALQAYDEALRDPRASAAARRYIRHERARMYALAGNDSAALAELRQALQASAEDEARDSLVALYDSKAILQHSRGMVHERLGDRAAAREAYAAALVEDLAFYPAHVRLALLAAADGDTAAAMSEMELAVQAAPDEPSVLYTQGTLLAQVGRLDPAAAALARAAELAPFYADPWFALGVVRDAQGDLAGARQAYEAFLVRAPGRHRWLAAARQRLSDLADAAPAAAPPAETATATPVF